MPDARRRIVEGGGTSQQNRSARQNAKPFAVDEHRLQLSSPASTSVQLRHAVDSVVRRNPTEHQTSSQSVDIRQVAASAPMASSFGGDALAAAAWVNELRRLYYYGAAAAAVAMMTSPVSFPFPVPPMAQQPRHGSLAPNCVVDESAASPPKYQAEAATPAMAADERIEDSTPSKINVWHRRSPAAHRRLLDFSIPSILAADNEDCDDVRRTTATSGAVDRFVGHRRRRQEAVDGGGSDGGREDSDDASSAYSNASSVEQETRCTSSSDMEVDVNDTANRRSFHQACQRDTTTTTTTRGQSEARHRRPTLPDDVIGLTTTTSSISRMNPPPPSPTSSLSSTTVSPPPECYGRYEPYASAYSSTFSSCGQRQKCADATNGRLSSPADSSGKQHHECTQCEKVYSSIGALKMHIRTHTLPCRCPLCDKAFSRPWLLQGHLRTHTGERPFRCTQCDRAFADRSNLRAHLQTHADVKRYGCERCGKTFSRASLLNKHNDGNCVGATVAV